MKDIFNTYIQSISEKFSHKETSEMGYRTDFEILLKGIFESINVRRIDHDARAKQGNKPDFVVLKNDVPILYIEAKDIGISLDKIEKSEQMTRYFGYSNLVLTDYLEFRFYRNGIRYEEPIKIANYDLKNRSIALIVSNYERAATTIIDFATSHKEPIKKGEHLAKIMGGKGQRIRDNVVELFRIRDKNDEIIKVYETIKKLLIHDLSPETFADMYAQTLVYGLFVARYYDETPANFSRREAQELIPASNPFLGHFFDHIAGRNFEKRLSFIVDELCEVFSHSDVKVLMTHYFKLDLFGNKNEGPDPVIHFYEDFLKEYDPELRKRMGAYYTPLPIVNFIIRSVDQILRKDFGLAQGLGDTTKLTNGKHKVQILDPATGTGTFLSATIDNIYNNLRTRKQDGSWVSYVHHDLLPRLLGFELMMSPYTIAHLKISLKLQETGFKYFNETKSGKTRLGVYLTNSLEDAAKQQNLLAFDFGAAIAEEAKKAAVIKNDTPIMVVIGNPPYSGESSNAFYTGHDVYKVEPTGGKLQERNSKWLNDDYVKFIRFAENMIDKTGEGVVAMITAHGYLDNPTFRGMRWHLMQTFDEIRVLDLHGNVKKREKAPDGSKDENVFDIQQGVAILIAIKHKDRRDKDVKIFRADCFGTRENKFKYLENSFEEIKWENISPTGVNLEWVVRDNEIAEIYEQGFSVAEIFPINSVCIVSGKDDEFIKFSKEEFDKEGVDDSKVRELIYRAFDTRYINYDPQTITRARLKVMKEFFKENLGLTFIRNDQGAENFSHVFVSKVLVDGHLHPGLTYAAPLYLYDDTGSRVPNLNWIIVNKIKTGAGKTTPEDIFDYIYAVLHSPTYREKYKEFLKIDFPRVPYPKDKKQFDALVALGHEIREIHLLESPKVGQFITTYPISGSDTIEKVSYKDGKVFINSEQYFGNVPEVAWNFYIGGYQPAQKWLKDRKGRMLSNSDIEHYQKIIVALVETARIMKEVDSIQ
ncbi:MAG: Adenine specific DNA methyltransferase [Microgenomates group bacterium GW2011_GWC1_39_7]|nr:MAG: Adenine specific DNA methyltransferase [Microgenomates group bacterium GW2011_GWC1_39_7]